MKSNNSFKCCFLRFCSGSKRKSTHGTETPKKSKHDSQQTVPTTQTTTQDFSHQMLSIMNLFGLSTDGTFLQGQASSSTDSSRQSESIQSSSTQSISDEHIPQNKSIQLPKKQKQPPIRLSMSKDISSDSLFSFENLTNEQQPPENIEPIHESDTNVQANNENIVENIVEDDPNSQRNNQNIVENIEAADPNVQGNIQNIAVAELPQNVPVFLQERIFENDAEFQLFLQREDCWSKLKKYYLNKGKKTVYRCNKAKRRGIQCEQSIYTLHDTEPNCQKIILFRNNSQHTHGNNPIVRKVADALKKKITDLYDGHMKKKSILYQLRNELDENQMPTDRQVQSVIDVHKDTKYGKTKITMEQLAEFAQQHSMIPDDIDSAFVVAFQQSPTKDDKWFRMFVSTKRLLENSINAKCMHADATYKMMLENFPLLVVGATDSGQHFHLLGLAISKYEKAEDYKFVFDAVQSGQQQVCQKVINLFNDTDFQYLIDDEYKRFIFFQ